jgi:hypothetical protein
MKPGRALWLLAVTCFVVPGQAAQAPAAASPMTPDQLEDFFMPMKKGTPIELTLEKGKIVHGLFSSYDDYYDTVWIVPQRSEQGIFREKSIKLTGIKHAALWDKKGLKTTPNIASPDGSMEMPSDEYYLLKESGK